jgi:protein TonB
MTAQTPILPPHEGSELKRWALAAAFVLFMHSGLMASYLMLASDEPEGSTESTAILIDLAPVPVAPSSQDDVAPGPEAVEAMPTPKPPPQEVKQEIAEPIEKVEAQSDVSLPLPEPKSEEQKKVEDPDKEKVKTEVETQQQMPSPKTTAAPRSNQQVAVAPQAPLPGADTRNRDATLRWQHLVGARLQQHKRYPTSAEGRRETGTVMLRFQVNRDGKVLTQSIVRSSGVPALDHEVLAMLQRAQPMPAFLTGMSQAQMTLTVPVEFVR